MVDALPRHHVTITGFDLMKTEVTQGMWIAVMGHNPSHFSSCGLECPVEQVTWRDAIRFANRVSELDGRSRCYDDDLVWDRDCDGYRLPTEAEWEYAARGGEDTMYAGGNDIRAVGWFDGNSDGTPHAVGQKAANGFALHDMSGNVWEWCWDREWAYQQDAQRDPTGSSIGTARVRRGGSWESGGFVGVTFRVGKGPDVSGHDIGLRLARSVRARSSE